LRWTTGRDLGEDRRADFRAAATAIVQEIADERFHGIDLSAVDY
jgi:hypothetical protein